MRNFPTAGSGKSGSYAGLLLKIAASSCLVFLIFNNSNLEEAMNRLHGIKATPIALAVAATLFWLSVLSALRWMIILNAFGARLGFTKAMQCVLIGSFFNQTPLSLIGGDAVRAWCGHRGGLDLSVAIRTVVLDRLIGVATLILVIAASLPWALEIMTDPVARITLLSGILGAAMLFTLLLALGWLPDAYHRGPAISAIVRIAVDGRKLCIRWRHIVPVVAMSVVTHCLAGLVVFLIANAMNIELGAAHALILTQPVMLMAMLPISVAGWGVREGAMVVALGFIGVESGDAVLISVTLGLVGIMASIPGAVVWLLSDVRAPGFMGRDSGA